MSNNAFMMPGGGLTNGKLALADADASDVMSGKTFYAWDKEIKTGTFDLSAADAGPGDVLSGKKFYSEDKTLKTGTYVIPQKLMDFGSYSRKLLWSNGSTSNFRSQTVTVAKYRFYYIVCSAYTTGTGSTVGVYVVNGASCFVRGGSNAMRIVTVNNGSIWFSWGGYSPNSFDSYRGEHEIACCPRQIYGLVGTEM